MLDGTIENSSEASKNWTQCFQNCQIVIKNILEVNFQQLLRLAFHFHLDFLRDFLRDLKFGISLRLAL